MAIYATSDLHGYPFDRFLSFLDSTGFCADDQLYILGDVVDRGMDGIRYLLWILEQPNVHFLLGNHEWMMLNCEFIAGIFMGTSSDLIDLNQQRMLEHWSKNGSAPTMMAIKELADTSPDQLEAVYDLLHNAPVCVPLTVGERKFLLVHGGLTQFDDENETFDYDEYSMLWHRPSLDERYFSSITTVIGHTPTAFYGKKYAGRMLTTDTWVDIDTGAASGGHPMLLRLDDMKEFYVS